MSKTAKHSTRTKGQWASWLTSTEAKYFPYNNNTKVCLRAYMHILLKPLVGYFWKNLNDSLIQYQFYIIFIRISLLIHRSHDLNKLKPPKHLRLSLLINKLQTSAKKLTLQLSSGELKIKEEILLH